MSDERTTDDVRLEGAYARYNNRYARWAKRLPKKLRVREEKLTRYLIKKLKPFDPI